MIAIDYFTRQTSAFFGHSSTASRRGETVWAVIYYYGTIPLTCLISLPLFPGSLPPLGFLSLAVCRQGEGDVVLLVLCSAWQTRWAFCHSWRGGPKHLTTHWVQNNPNPLKCEDSSQETRSKRDTDFHRQWKMENNKVLVLTFFIFKFIKYFILRYGTTYT